jgi:hypothetical protein
MTMPSEDTRTLVERSEEELSWFGLAVAGTMRVAELAAIALAALLVCPPLMILVVLVVVPTVALAAVVALIASVIALPVLIVRHLHGHRAAHSHLRVRRLGELGRTRMLTATSRFHRVVARALAKLSAPERPSRSTATMTGSEVGIMPPDHGEQSPPTVGTAGPPT